MYKVRSSIFSNSSKHHRSGGPSRNGEKKNIVHGLNLNFLIYEVDLFFFLFFSILPLEKFYLLYRSCVVFGPKMIGNRVFSFFFEQPLGKTVLHFYTSNKGQPVIV